MVAALREKGLAEKCVVLSFRYEQLEKVHALAPEIRLWYLSEKLQIRRWSSARRSERGWILSLAISTTPMSG